MPKKLIPAVAGPVLFTVILGFFRPVGLELAGVATLAATTWMAVWWVFEVTSISVTALLPIVLFPLTAALPIEATTAAYGHKYIFLYMGGFFLAIAIERWQLHRRIALVIINLVGSSISNIVLGFMLATAFMSMWISNTATSVMILPIGLAIVAQLSDYPGTVENENKLFGKLLMLAIAYSASIGGMATLFGTPPNLVFAGVVQDLYGIEIGFAEWLKVGLPVSAFLLLVAWVYLTKFAFPLRINEFPGGRAEIRRLKKELGPASFEEKSVMTVFVGTAVLLIFRSYLQQFAPALDDSIIALAAGISLCLLPASKKGERLLTWESAVKMPWGVLILFGGGMALARAFTASGLAVWIGEQFTLLENLPLFLQVIILILCVNFLTEITSNLATTAMLLPILAPMAMGLNVHPYLLLVSATLAASCAFMLPVATPPNAVVFGSGLLNIRDMVRAGAGMNVLSVLLLALFLYFLLGVFWGLDPGSFPADFGPSLGCT